MITPEMITALVLGIMFLCLCLAAAVIDWVDGE